MNFNCYFNAKVSNIFITNNVITNNIIRNLGVKSKPVSGIRYMRISS